MSKHTPGPWGIEKTDDTNWVGFMRPDGRKVELIVCKTNRYEITDEALERNDANARLIAAAPELLALLEAVIETRGSHFISNSEPGMHEWDERALSVLAKVRG